MCAHMSTQTDECLFITAAEQEFYCPLSSLLQPFLAPVVYASPSGRRDTLLMKNPTMIGVATTIPGACTKLPLWSKEDASLRPFTEGILSARVIGKVHMKPFCVTDDEATSFLYLSSDTS